MQSTWSDWVDWQLQYAVSEYKADITRSKGWQRHTAQSESIRITGALETLFPHIYSYNMHQHRRVHVHRCVDVDARNVADEAYIYIYICHQDVGFHRRVARH